MHLKPGEAWEYCPREALRRASKVLKDEFNLVLSSVFSLKVWNICIILQKSAICTGNECRLREWVCSLKEYFSVWQQIIHLFILLNSPRVLWLSCYSWRTLQGGERTMDTLWLNTLLLHSSIWCCFPHTTWNCSFSSILEYCSGTGRKKFLLLFISIISN